MPAYKSRETYSPDALRLILIKKGLSPEDVARRSKGALSYQTVRDMVKGVRPTVRSHILTAIAKALYVSEDELRGEE